jgi:hypothetical protein
MSDTETAQDSKLRLLRELAEDSPTIECRRYWSLKALELWCEINKEWQL